MKLSWNGVLTSGSGGFLCLLWAIWGLLAFRFLFFCSWFSMGGGLPSTESLSIILSMVLSIVSIMSSCELKVECCSKFVSTFCLPPCLLHSPLDLFLFLPTAMFTSTYMESFIMVTKEVDLLSLSHKKNSPSKYFAYRIWVEPMGGLNWAGIELYTFMNLSKNSWKKLLSFLFMEWY